MPSALAPWFVCLWQVKSIDKETRHAYAELVIALAAGDREAIIAKYKQIGVMTKSMDPHILWCLATFWNDHDDVSVTGGRCVGFVHATVCWCVCACAHAWLCARVHV